MRVGGEVQYEEGGKTPQIYRLDGGDDLRKFLAGAGGGDLFPAAGKLTYTRVKDKK